MVEPSSGCLAVGAVGVVEPLGCVGVGGVGMVELLSRCVTVGVGAVAVQVGVALDDHYHRSINGRPISRQNERAGILSQIPPQRPIASFAELRAPLGSTWRSIDSWRLSFPDCTARLWPEGRVKSTAANPVFSMCCCKGQISLFKL